jgi:hypothetical protein
MQFKSTGLAHVAFVLTTALVGISPARAEIEVSRVVLVARSAQQPGVRLIVTSDGQGSRSARLWKGDYLWANCSGQGAQKAGQTSRRFVCGSQMVEFTQGAGIVLASAGEDRSKRIR